MLRASVLVTSSEWSGSLWPQCLGSRNISDCTPHSVSCPTFKGSTGLENSSIYLFATRDFPQPVKEERENGDPKREDGNENDDLVYFVARDVQWNFDFGQSSRAVEVTHQEICITNLVTSLHIFSSTSTWGVLKFILRTRSTRSHPRLFVTKMNQLWKWGWGWLDQGKISSQLEVLGSMNVLTRKIKNYTIPSSLNDLLVNGGNWISNISRVRPWAVRQDTSNNLH